MTLVLRSSSTAILLNRNLTFGTWVAFTSKKCLLLSYENPPKSGQSINPLGERAKTALHSGLVIFTAKSQKRFQLHLAGSNLGFLT